MKYTKNCALQTEQEGSRNVETFSRIQRKLIDVTFMTIIETGQKQLANDKHVLEAFILFFTGSIIF